MEYASTRMRRPKMEYTSTRMRRREYTFKKYLNIQYYYYIIMLLFLTLKLKEELWI